MNNHPLSSLISNQNLLEKIAKNFGTPLYVYSEDRLKENISRLSNAIRNSFKNHQIYYAVKANSNIHIISTLKESLNGLGCDCSSPGELYAAKESGVKMSDCVYTGNYESIDDLKAAYESGCEINLDDLSSFNRLENIGIPEYISFRLNPGKGHGQFKGIMTGGKDSKFGIPKEKITNAYVIAKKKGIKRFGLQCHAGSSTLDIKTFSEVTKLVLDSAKEIEKCIDQRLEKISIGSGFGIPYKDTDKPLDLDLLFQKIQKIFYDYYGQNSSDWPILCIEPGRILVADTGFILTKVTGVKSSYKNFIGLDAGMETLMRPALYGAFHRVQKIGKESNNTSVYDITGRICENTDRISKNYTLPKTEEGDLCAIMDTGAYGYSMSHNFNTRPRPSEILINNKNIKLIRKRESIEDLFRGCDV
tara:strand:- start:327 stop:1580 length:1254 start_codon:yes stop_codon:yes gene_type:complete